MTIITHKNGRTTVERSVINYGGEKVGGVEECAGMGDGGVAELVLS